MSQVVGSTAGMIGESIGTYGASKKLQRGYQVAGEQERLGYERAAAEQEAAQREAMALYQPYAEAGLAGLQQYQEALGQGPYQLGYEDVMQDPGYQFRAAAGQQAIERSAAAKGGRLSGGTLADLATYQQGLASQEYQNAWERGNLAQQQYLSGLAGLGTMGYQAAGAQADIRGLSGQNLANIRARMGESQAQAELGRYGAKAGMYQGLGQAFSKMSYSQGEYLGSQESEAGQTMLSAYMGGM